MQEIGFDEYINFQRSLVELLRENLNKYPVICNYPDVSHKIMKERLSCGLPVLSLEWLKLCLDHAIMDDLFERILLVIKKHRLLNDENEKKLELMKNSISSLPENMVCTYLKKQSGFLLELNKEMKKLLFDLSALIADILSRHVVLDINRRVPRIDERIKWEKNYCPFCGGTPFLLIIYKELKRIKLRCRLCYTSWDFEEKRCPFCKNEDEEYLQTYNTTEHSQFFLLFCNNCKKYIKVIKEDNGERENVEEDIFMIDANTISLDSFAQNEGFSGSGIKGDFDSLIEKDSFSKERTGGVR